MDILAVRWKSRRISPTRSKYGRKAPTVMQMRMPSCGLCVCGGWQQRTFQLWAERPPKYRKVIRVFSVCNPKDLLTTVNIQNSPSSSLMKVAGMSHHTVGHQHVILRTYSLHFDDGNGWRRTVLKHCLCLLRKTETVYICKLQVLFHVKLCAYCWNAFIRSWNLQLLATCTTGHSPDSPGMCCIGQLVQGFCDLTCPIEWCWF